MKLPRFFWLIPILAFSIWLSLPKNANALLENTDINQVLTPIPGIPPGVDDILQTHFPGVMIGVAVIVIIILVGTLIKPKK